MLEVGALPYLTDAGDGLGVSWRVNTVLFDNLEVLRAERRAIKYSRDADMIDIPYVWNLCVGDRSDWVQDDLVPLIEYSDLISCAGEALSCLPATAAALPREWVPAEFQMMLAYEDVFFARVTPDCVRVLVQRMPQHPDDTDMGTLDAHAFVFNGASFLGRGEVLLAEAASCYDTSFPMGQFGLDLQLAEPHRNLLSGFDCTGKAGVGGHQLGGPSAVTERQTRWEAVKAAATWQDACSEVDADEGCYDPMKLFDVDMDVAAQELAE